MADRNEPLDTLEVFSLSLIIQNMRNLTSKYLAAPRPLVYADHGDAHGPRGVADAEGHVDVVGPDILLQYTELYQDVQRIENLAA